MQRAVNIEAMSHSPKTVRNQYALLTATLAVYYPGFAPAAKLPPKVKREMTIPERDELTAILDAAKGTQMELPVVLAAFMGLRRSEIAALTPADYDGRTLRINKAMVVGDDGAYHVKAPKSYAGTRELTVPDFVRETLTRCPLPVRPNPVMMTDAFKAIRRAAGVSVRFHDLRHYYASLLLASGVPDKYAMKRMGHATPNMLKSVYQHTMRDADAAVDAAINQAVLRAACHES